MSTGIYENFEIKKSEYCCDTTLIKIFLNTIKDGDLNQIKNYIQKYNFNITTVKDNLLEQNPIFYAALIKEDLQ